MQNNEYGGNMTSSGEDNGINTFDRGELIAGVVRKHKRFLDEYTAEFTQLDNRISSINEKLSSAKRSREDIVLRTEILREKRQQLYHQVDQLLEDVLGSVDLPKIDRKLVSSIYESFLELKSSSDIDGEKEIKVTLMGLLSQVPGDKHVKETINQIGFRLDNAIGSRAELASIEGSENNFDDVQVELDKELNEISSRHSWLDRRIKSHNEALEYWENAKKVPTANETGAVVS